MANYRAGCGPIWAYLWSDGGHGMADLADMSGDFDGHCAICGQPYATIPPETMDGITDDPDQFTVCLVPASNRGGTLYKRMCDLCMNQIARKFGNQARCDGCPYQKRRKGKLPEIPQCGTCTQEQPGQHWPQWVHELLARGQHLANTERADMARTFQADTDFADEGDGTPQNFWDTGHASFGLNVRGFKTRLGAELGASGGFFLLPWAPYEDEHGAMVGTLRYTGDAAGDVGYIVDWRPFDYAGQPGDNERYRRACHMRKLPGRRNRAGTPAAIAKREQRWERRARADNALADYADGSKRPAEDAAFDAVDQERQGDRADRVMADLLARIWAARANTVKRNKTPLDLQDPLVIYGIRCVLTFDLFFGTNQAEIADMLGLSQGTVSRILDEFGESAHKQDIVLR